MRALQSKAFLLASLAGAGSAIAQDDNQVFLDATYLGAPTDWCAAHAGIPTIVKMDGPDIVAGPTDFPRRVRVNSGGKVRDVVIGEYIGSFNHSSDFAGPHATVIGRFSAEFQICFSVWDTPRATGNWHLMGKDGSEEESGAFENEHVSSMYLPFFRGVSGLSEPHYAQFGDRRLFTATRPKTTTTQTFAADPDKE